MKKLHFSILIDAPKEKVWDTVIGKDTYPQWTEVFSPGSHFQGSWEKGSKMLLLSPKDNGKHDGMVSEIAENNPPEFLSIKHVGLLKDDVEDTTSERVKKWSPAYENYTLKEVDGKTEFIVDMDGEDEYVDFFNEIWPKALEKLKEVAEKGESSTVSVTTWIKAPIGKIWEYYTSPEHITKWAFASDDWEAPHAENDLRVGGRFVTTMAAKDGSAKFDFSGVYTKVQGPSEASGQGVIEYKMDDGRMAFITFINGYDAVQVIVTFDIEHENPREVQKEGWQAILNNFKKHVEQA